MRDKSRKEKRIIIKILKHSFSQCLRDKNAINVPLALPRKRERQREKKKEKERENEKSN